MSFEPFLALEASAGSGKTFALSVRFVALILKGARVSEILALTFSKKATNEMKERIIDTFLNLKKEDKKNELNALCALLEKSESEILALRDLKKEEFLRSDLKIFTFDSFFAKILRAFSLNLGLMSDFEISEEELDTQALFIKCLSQSELESLALYMQKVDHRFLDDLEILYKNAFKDEVKAALEPSLEPVKTAFFELKDYALSLSQNTHLTNNFEFKTDEFSPNELCDHAIIKDLNKNYFKIFINDEIFLKKRQNLIDALNAYANALETFKIHQIQSLLEKYKFAKNALNKEKNTLSFKDVALNVYELSQQEGFSDLVYFHLDAQISHLLIDEFQDTDFIQYEILKPLISELVSGKGAKEWRSFFYVGDKKQSIYGFRGGKKELFDKLQQDFPQIKLEKLDTNYRSGALLVDFVNEVFKNKYKGYKPQKSVNLGGFIKITMSENSSQTPKNCMFEAALKELEFLKLKGANLNKTAILCWQNKEADELVAFLKERNFKAYTQSNILLEKKANICVLLEYAKYCIFGDLLYLENVKALLNPAFLIEQEQLNRILKTKTKPKLFIPARLELRLNENPAQICLYLAKKLKLNLADSALIQYLEYARSKENFLELLFEPCLKKTANDENLGISMMTVHKSKGLEFENVILLDAISQSQNDKSHLMLEIDIQKGVQLKIKDSIRQATKEPDFTHFIQKKEQGELENDLNSLYVAFTRAKNALFVIKKHIAVSRVANYFDDEKYLKLECFEKGEILPSAHSKEDDKSVDKKLEFVKIPTQTSEKNIAPNSDAIRFGEAFHYMMQHLSLKDFSNLERLKTRIFKLYHHFLDEKSLKDLINRVCNLINEPKFRALIKDKEHLKEQPISFENQIKQLDLLCLSDDEALIIDYKTGEQDTSEHQTQVKTYKKGIEAILQKPSTKAVLIYALKDEIKFIEI